MKGKQEEHDIKAEEWNESYKWQYEGYPLFTSAYQKLAGKTNEKYFVRWTRFINYFNNSQFEGYIPKKDFLETGKMEIDELICGNPSFLKDLERIHKEMIAAINLSLKIRKSKKIMNFKEWWIPTQKALSDVAGILFAFDYAMDEFIKNMQDEDIKLLNNIKSNITPERESFINEAQKRLFELKKTYKGDFDKIIPKFIEEYGWFQNSYKGKFEITKEWLMGYLKDHKEESNKYKKEKLDKKYSLLVKAASKAITFRDDKKKLLLIVVDLIESWLRELCIEKYWDFDEIKWLSMDEIINVLDNNNNNNNNKIINSAKKYAKENKRYGLMREDGYIDINPKLWEQVELLHKTEEIVNEIKGMIGNKGKVIGKVRIILDARGTDIKINKNEILVTSMTRPEFLPLMQKAAAFITNEGGITSHAAIVAREMNKPAIIGTKIATQVLHDGDLVEVDADNGIVRVLERAR